MNASEVTFQKANTSVCAFDILEGKLKKLWWQEFYMCMETWSSDMLDSACHMLILLPALFQVFEKRLNSGSKNGDR